MLGIIVADEMELAKVPLPEHFKLINQFRVYELTIALLPAVLIISGVGLANAAAAAQVLISVFNASALYNFGSVGAYGSALKINTLVIPERVYYHDVITPWYVRGELPYEEAFYQVAVPPELLAAYAHYNLASGNSFFTSVADAANLAKNWNVAIYDMEGAAIAQIAAQNGVPFLSVKCVSDLIGGANAAALNNLNARISASAAKAYDLLIKIITLQTH